MLGSACFLGLVAGLGNTSYATAAVNEANPITSSGLITEVSAGRQADLVLPNAETPAQPTTLVVLPNTNFLAAANTVSLPTSSVSSLETLTTESQATLPSLTSTSEAESATVTPMVVSVPTLATELPTPMATNPVEFNFIGSTMFEQSATQLLADASLTQAQTSAPVVVPSSVSPSPISTQIAQLTGVDLQIIAPITRRASIPRLPSLDLPPLSGPERFLPNDGGSTVRFVMPAQGVFTSGYGPRWGRMHRGIDIAGPVGTPIVAAAAGVVVTAEWNSGGFGNLVEIRHADGSKTLYAHNNRILVRPGQEVQQGEQISEMGSTGRSTGPHLHFEIHPAGVGAVNPMLFLNRG